LIDQMIKEIHTNSCVLVGVSVWLSFDLEWHL